MSETTINRLSKTPYYDQLKRILEEQLSDGSLSPGDMLPTEPEFCERYAVSRTVVRQALGELSAEGRIYRLRGKGTFVTGRRVAEHFLRPTLGFFDDLTAAGHQVRNEVRRCETAVVDVDRAQQTGFPEGEVCVELDRTRYVNGDITAFMTSYIPTKLHPRLFELLTKFDLETNSLYRFLEDITGIGIHSGHRTVRAVAATKFLATELDVRSGSPLLCIESVERDAHDRRVEFSLAWHRSDRAMLEMEVVRQ
jgi:GntR family transcriptional regulator